MKLAIIGSRGLTDYGWFKQQVYNHFFHEDMDGDGGTTQWFGMREVISGGATGADQFAARLVREWNEETGNEIKLTEHLPNWDLYGKRAGFVRNELIIKDADMVLAFWGVDPKTGEYSRGTGHSLSIAKRMKKTSLIIYF